MEHINAPYNFVPLSDKVVTPDWADQVSQDLPFRDGISGELELTITAQTDILVGGRKIDANDGAKTSGSVHFFQMENGKGKYAIPGSSLRGMIRNVMEIATFSRMNAVDDRSFGLRDLTRGSVYADKAIGRGKVKTGLLSMLDGNRVVIKPCDMARLDHRDIEKWLGVNKPLFSPERDSDKGHKRVADKYERWKSVSTKVADEKGYISCDVETVGERYLQEERVVSIGSGSVTALPVFTGQVSDKKHKDFVFYNMGKAPDIDVDAYDENAWRDFLFIHHDAETSHETDMSWPNYWRQEFRAGRDVPVFYIQSDEQAVKGRLQIGLAYLPKLAGDFSIYDMIRNTSKKHLEDNGFDFPSLIFGTVGQDEAGKDRSLKGRVFIEPAIQNGDEKPDASPVPTILNGAKPSYFPNYLQQPVNAKGDALAAGKQYATYLKTDDNAQPKIRGWKRYPARADYEPQGLSDDQTSNYKVQTKLHTLPASTSFRCRVLFHNLKAEELGALVWSTELEGNRHSLGMGKSFGAGQVTLEIDWDKSDIWSNDPANEVLDSSGYVGVFQRYMKDEWLNTDWADTDQVRSLLSMTDHVGVSERFAGKLTHMKLDNGSRGNSNDFVNAKNNKPGLVLAPFEGKQSVSTRVGCPWVDETIKDLATKNRVPDDKLDQVLYGKGLAEAWEGLTDEALKDEALSDIQARWSTDDWKDPQGKARKKARAIYGD